MDAYFSARIDASVDVELQLVAVLQLETQACPLFSQTSPAWGWNAFCVPTLSLSPVQDGNLVAQDLGLVHVVR